MSHSPEPWEVELREPHVIVDEQGAQVCVCQGPDTERMAPNARRIVACVNACARLPSNLLEDGNFKTLMHTLVQYAVLDDKIGMEQTGWVLGRLIARHIKASEGETNA